MSKKIHFVIVFVCLLAACNHALAFDWGPNNTWMAAVDQNWFDANNWWDPNFIPNIYIHALVPSNAPEGVSGPIINGDAACMYLNIEPWSQGRAYTEWGVDMNSGTLDVNYGIAIGAFQSFAISDGGIPTFTIHGGTVRQLLRPGDGVLVGGGGDGYGVTFGKLYMYSGSLTTPRLELRNGEILLYGGTIECDSNSENSDPNFAIYTYLPLPTNRIDMSGGTLKLNGDKVAELNSLISARRIVSLRGTLGSPAYTDGNTVLTSTFMPGIAWNSAPANLETGVRYHLNSPKGLTLSWKAGDWIGRGSSGNDGHYVFFGSVLNDVSNAGIGTAGTGSSVYRGHVYHPEDDVNGDPNLFIAEVPLLAPGTIYYYRVDEVNVADPCVHQGLVWKFTTKSAAASDPSPAIGGGLKMPLELTWMAGDWTTDVNEHRIYFGTSATELNSANTGSGILYRGTVNDPVYPLSKLLEDRDSNGVPDYILAANTTYYWRIDEKSPAGTYTALTRLNGSFNTGSFVSIDDFQSYFDTDDLNDIWVEAPIVCDGGTLSGSGQIEIIRDGPYDRWMQFTYDKTGGANGRYYSEIGRPYNDADWVPAVLASAPKVLEIWYRGAALNGNDPDYDRMYVAVEDTGGDVSITLHPDPDAQQRAIWTNWAITYKTLEVEPVTSDLVDLNHVDYLYLGAGYRCADDYYGGGEGNIMFDDIRVLSGTCVPSEGPVADFDDDCIVDLRDLDSMSNDWLQHGEDRYFEANTPPSKAPILWYKLDETGSTTQAQDSGTGDENNYLGTINNWSTQTWKPTGGRGSNNGCLYLPSGGNSYVSIDVASLSFMGDANHSGPDGGGITFATWINADLTSPSFLGWVYGFIVVQDNNGNDATDIACPHHHNWNDWSANNAWAGWTKGGGSASFSFGPSTTAANYGGRWNHWAFVKAPHTLSWYCNGALLKQEADTDANSGDPNIYGPLFPLPVSEFTIGLGGWGGNWAGYIDDFQVYDYALSAAEVAYLATDGDGHLILPLGSPANINRDGSTLPPEEDPNQIVNFGDLALMVNEWMTEKLWP